MNTKKGFLFAMALCLICSCSKNKDKGDEAVLVKTEVVGRASSAEGTSYSGTIEEMTGTALSFGSAGTIATMNVKEGMTVGAGQVLATLDGKTQKNMLLSAESANDMSKESVAQAEDAYARMKMLHDAGSISDMQWVDVETKLNQAKATLKATESQVSIAEKGVADTRLTAPFSGFVSSKMADVGQQVAPGVPVVRIVNISQVKAKFSVPEAEVSSLHVGDPMTVSVATMPDKLFEGQICEKSISADAISRSYDVWVLLPNGDHKLLPGMLCEVAKPDFEKSETIAINAQYVLIDETNQRFVWIVKDGKATKRNISTGENIGQKVTVLSGLSLGDSLITDGNQKVAEGIPCVTAKQD